MSASPLNATEPSAGGTLVVLDPDAPETTLRRAVPDAAAGEHLHLLLVYPDSEYERRERAHAEAGVSPRRGVHGLADEARRVAERVGKRCLGPGADFGATGAVGRRRERIVEAVEEHAIERVFVSGSRVTRGTLRERVLAFLGRASPLDRALPEGVTVTTIEDRSGAADDGAVRSGLSPRSDG